MIAYPTTEESEDDRAGGGRIHPLLLEVSKVFHSPKLEKDGKKRVKHVQCAARKGCGTTWTYPQAKGQIFKHAKSCGYLTAETICCIIKEMADKAVLGGPALVKVGGDDESRESDDAHLANEDAPPAKRIKTSMATSSSKSNSALDGYVREGRKALQDRADHALLIFVTCCGILPKVVDAQEFFFLTLNTKYSPPSESTLWDMLIPEEAAKIQGD